MKEHKGRVRKHGTEMMETWRRRDTKAVGLRLSSTPQICFLPQNKGWHWMSYLGEHDFLARSHNLYRESSLWIDYSIWGWECRGCVGCVHSASDRHKWLAIGHVHMPKSWTDQSGLQVQWPNLISHCYFAVSTSELFLPLNALRQY